MLNSGAERPAFMELAQTYIKKTFRLCICLQSYSLMKLDLYKFIRYSESLKESLQETMQNNPSKHELGGAEAHFPCFHYSPMASAHRA